MVCIARFPIARFPFGSIMQSTNLTWFLRSDLEPIFWTPERLDKPSAWWGHVPFAFWMTVACKPRLLVELGTHYGVSYAAFCEAVSRSRLGTSCYAVDAWAGDAHAGFYGDDIYNELKDFHDKRYASFSELLRKSFDEACGSFEDGTIDLLHIDGYRTYEAVRHDFETWRPKLSERAIVLFHDTNVRRDDFGVWRFFGELRKELPSFEFLHGHGLGVVAVGTDAPAAIKELCGLTQNDEIAAVRERFSYFGARWTAAAGENLKSAELSARLRQIEDSVAQKDAQVVHLEGEFSLAKRNAEDLAARLQQLEDSVAQKDAEIGAKQAQIDEFLYHLNRINASPWWRFGMWFTRLICAPLQFIKRKRADLVADDRDGRKWHASEVYAGPQPYYPGRDVADCRSEALHRLVCVEGNVEETLQRPSSRGVCLYMTYTTAPRLHGHHKIAISAIRKTGYSVIILNNHPGHAREFCLSAKDQADVVICRSNVGYDFGAWCDFVLLYTAELAKAKYVIFLNDSLLGPRGDLNELLERAEQSEADIYGLSDSYQHRYHLQSSFLHMKGRLFADQVFLDWFTNYSVPNDKLAVIHQGEIGFSQYMLANGFRLGCLAPYEDVAKAAAKRGVAKLQNSAKVRWNARGRGAQSPSSNNEDHAAEWYANVVRNIRKRESLNPQHIFWDVLIDEFGYPFVKRDLFIRNPEKVPNIDDVMKICGMDSPLVHAIDDARKQLSG